MLCYSSTFQLFMDMPGIECITVFGIPDYRGVRHSWDDPIGRSPNHKFFNVTSSTLRNSDIHNWDEANIPETAAGFYGFKE